MSDLRSSTRFAEFIVALAVGLALLGPAADANATSGGSRCNAST